MSNHNYTYGSSVAEIYKHSDVELQALIKNMEVQYFRHCESPAYPQLGVNVDWFSDKPLTQALNDLIAWTNEGYTVASSLNRPLYLKLQLKKPQELIDADLLKLADIAADEYEKNRYNRNATETARQVAISVERSERQAAAKAAQVAAKRQETEEQKALDDLLRAHGKPDVQVAA